MAREYFKNLPDRTTPLRAERINGLLNGEESIEKIVAGSIEGKNLFDETTATNITISATGAIASNNSYKTSDYITIIPSQSYYFFTTQRSGQTTKQIYLAYYDSSKTFISRDNYNLYENSFITPSNAKYVRAGYYSDGQEKPQLEIGSTATDYVPYMKYGYNSEESMGSIVVDDIEGKNLYNATKVSYATNAVTYKADTNKLYMNGTPSSDGRIQFGKSIYLKRGKYTFSMTLSSGTINRNTTFYLYSGTNSTEISWTVVSSLTVTPTINNVATVTFNVANGGYIFLANYLYTNQTFTNAEFNYIIEKGDKFTGFISYDTYANSKREEYSTGEEKIGRWIDGKILYRKTINTGALPNNTTKIIAHNISNIDFIVHTYGSASNGTNFFSLPLPYNTLADTIICFANKTNVLIATGTDRSSYTTSYVTLEYTKTTD